MAVILALERERVDYARQVVEKGAVVEVQTGAERVVRSNVGRCPRARVLIPSPWDPKVADIIHPRGRLMRRLRRKGIRAPNSSEFFSKILKISSFDPMIILINFICQYISRF